MTYEKAIGFAHKLALTALELNVSEQMVGDTLEFVGMVIETLEKQMPKKPILKDGESVLCVDYADGSGEVKRNEWKEWTCPDCSWFVGEQYVRINGKTHNQRKCKFCSSCGKAIDWSKE